MDFKILASFAAPLITAFIAFLLGKYFYNKPKLIVYYGHISAHRIPNNTGYALNLISLTTQPIKAQCDSKFRELIPLIIKSNTKIWIFGLDAEGNTKLTESLNPILYQKLVFFDNPQLIKEIPVEIYNDIISNEANFSTIAVGTHEVVVRNSGKLSAKNVRLGHTLLPSYNVYPNTKYEIANLQNGGKEILFPTLVPNEQITISYLYFAPTTYAQINAYVKSDEGLATVIKVIPTPNIPTWKKLILYVLLFIGSSTVIYFCITFIAELKNYTSH